MEESGVTPVRVSDVKMGKWYASKLSPEVSRKVIPNSEPGFIGYLEGSCSSGGHWHADFSGQTSLRGMARWATGEIEPPPGLEEY